MQPGSQKALPQLGAMQLPAMLGRCRHRQAACPLPSATQAQPGAQVAPLQVPEAPEKAPASSAQSGPPSAALASAPSGGVQSPASLKQSAKQKIEPQLGVMQTRVAAANTDDVSAVVVQDARAAGSAGGSVAATSRRVEGSCVVDAEGASAAVPESGSIRVLRAITAGGGIGRRSTVCGRRALGRGGVIGGGRAVARRRRVGVRPVVAQGAGAAAQCRGGEATGERQ